MVLQSHYQGSQNSSSTVAPWEKLWSAVSALLAEPEDRCQTVAIPGHRPHRSQKHWRPEQTFTVWEREAACKAVCTLRRKQWCSWELSKGKWLDLQTWHPVKLGGDLFRAKEKEVLLPRALSDIRYFLNRSLNEGKGRSETCLAHRTSPDWWWEVGIFEMFLL